VEDGRVRKEVRADRRRMSVVADARERRVGRRGEERPAEMGWVVGVEAGGEVKRIKTRV
jgi:hypothetical protein